MRHRFGFLQPSVLGIVCSLTILTGEVTAYEYENAVPLTITAAAEMVTVESVAISLNGHDVVIATKLHNETHSLQPIAFYAHTPLFSQSGIGEEYIDKSFPNLTVLVNGRSRYVNTNRRAFFMGHDITPMLVRAGLSPLPDIDADWKKIARLPKVQGVKPENWQGFVVHGWTDTMLSQQKAIHQVRYRSMPQFGLVELASQHFDTTVRQHCGEPTTVKEALRRLNPEQDYVLLERHDFPVPYMSSLQVRVDVTQPRNTAFRPQPVVTLICGISNPAGGKDIGGQIEDGPQTVSVLVISILEVGVPNPAFSEKTKEK